MRHLRFLVAAAALAVAASGFHAATAAASWPGAPLQLQFMTTVKRLTTLPVTVMTLSGRAFSKVAKTGLEISSGRLIFQS